MSDRGRFAAWLRRDDHAKVRHLHAVGRGEKGDTDPATLRAWLREDGEFAQAVKVARTQPPGEPALWTYDAQRGRYVSSREIVLDPDPDPHAPPPPGSSEREIEQQGWRMLQ